MLDNLPPMLEEVHFSVLSVYPEEDKQLNKDCRVEIVAAKPLALVLAVPLAAVWAVFRRLHLPLGPLRRDLLLSTLEKSDLLIDLAGICFTDGRGIELIYNVACILPALLLGKKVIKCSQAMGPFERPLNRWAARTLLPRVTLNIARGQQTLNYLKRLGLENVVLCADTAFAMKERMSTETEEALATLDHFGGQKIVGISASAVVQVYCQQRSIDYCRLLANFIDQVISRGYGAWLLAHAFRKSRKDGRTSDVDTCQAVYDLLEEKQHCHMVTEDYSPSTLRTIIGECDYFVASRFHAMVSSFAKKIPTIVISWSHKYVEVLEMFELEEWIIGHQELSPDILWARFQEMVESESEIKEKIARHLPKVLTSSLQNAVLVVSLLRN